jgi:hypothetical protein
LVRTLEPGNGYFLDTIWVLLETGRPIDHHELSLLAQGGCLPGHDVAIVCGLARRCGGAPDP